MKTITMMVFCLVLRAEEEPAAGFSHKPQTEFLASSQFQSLLLVQPLTGGLNLEARLYRTPDIHEDVMVLGGSYSLELLSKRIKLVPGLNVFAGRDERTSPAVSLRAKAVIAGSPHDKHLVAETSMFRALLPTIHGRHDTHVDITHISVETRRFALGAATEFVQYREDHELKLGGRFQYKISKHWSLLALPLWPIGHGKFELRGGVLFDPTAH